MIEKESERRAAPHLPDYSSGLRKSRTQGTWGAGCPMVRGCERKEGTKKREE